ncbi:unnamed protein product [Caenorhabditis sp. 36 PRJEB53466]|nr:unnamed protein product [Caenorhabditis sp. 36 PRJEB53466]
MKSSALPEPKPYDGSSDLGEFKRAFLLKYHHVVEDDEELITILEDRFLKGPAKSLFKTLQGRFCRPVKELFEEFERKLKWRAEETGAGKHEAKLGKRAARLNKIREYHVGNGNSCRERNRDGFDRDGGSRVIVDKVSHKSLGTLATGQLSIAEKLEKEKEIGGRREPKKTVVREADLVIGPRLKFNSPAYFDIKAKADVAWTEKYDWKGVEKVVMLAKWTVDPTENENRAEIIESIAKDVKDLIVVPIRMACKFNEVGGITEWWKKRMRTSTNVRFVDPQTPVGPKQLPMVVVIPEKFDSAEMMGGYLDSLIPRNAAVEKLMVGRKLEVAKRANRST